MRERPEPGINNVWYHYNESDTAFVFVHGILSDSRTCWFYEDKSEKCYWPELVLEDQRLGEPSVFLGGYYTAIDSGPYEIRDCASELYRCLKRPDPEGRPPALDKDSIVFICHSTGGIVARYMLESNQGDFASKPVGLVLIASPSYGSKLENKIDWLARFYGQKLGQQLQWGSWSLRDLDMRFKDLVAQKRIPGLSGVEAYENHFIVHRKWLPDKAVVVTEESAGKYFGAPILLRDTDHFSAAKPDCVSHPSNRLLVDFYGRFRGIVTELLTCTASDVPGTEIAKKGEATASRQGADQLTFTRVSDFWKADPGALKEGGVVVAEGTISEFAPLLIGPPEEKRSIHREYRNWLSTDEQLDDEKRGRIDAYLAYSAGQMVWRLDPLASNWRFLGLYQGIVRNSIALFVERDYFDRIRTELFPADRLCVDARVTGRLRRLRGQMLDRLADSRALEGPIHPAIESAEGRPVFGLFVDGKDSRIEAVQETSYLDGDMWVAVRTGPQERFISRFGVDLSDPEDVRRESQALKEEVLACGEGTELVFEFDQIERLFPERTSVPRNRILKQLIA